jgi:hypothetical protein
MNNLCIMLELFGCAFNDNIDNRDINKLMSKLEINT